MELIDRYIYAVTTLLPSDIQGDIGKELRSNIEDMLSDSPTQDEIKLVLEKLGRPSKLALEYQPKKHYLIGPMLYANYIAILKLVIPIMVTLTITFNLLDWMFVSPIVTTTIDSMVALISLLFADGISSTIQGAFWVTLIFGILEKQGMGSSSSLSNKPWTVDELPSALVSHKKIPRKEPIASIVRTLFLASILLIKHENIAIFEKINGNYHITPFLNLDRLGIYLIPFVLLVLIQFSIDIWKFTNPYRTYSLSIISTVKNVSTILFLLVALWDSKLLNMEALNQLKDMGIPNLFHISVLAIIIALIWNSVASFNNYKR